ncbi:N-acetyltransferase 8-like isoform X2 [Hypanus sabinus]|nr:N-acetyltransferase 8-like isoform X2 [Hypanus sabinus]XP_059806724.1 N-acetyltransferase 8-like isoform X2 [Hypanus sabinus]
MAEPRRRRMEEDEEEEEAEVEEVPGGFTIRPCQRSDFEAVRRLYREAAAEQVGTAFRQALRRPAVRTLLSLCAALPCLGLWLGLGPGLWAAATLAGPALAAASLYGACLRFGRASAAGPLREDLADIDGYFLRPRDAGLWVAEVGRAGPPVGMVAVMAETDGPAGSCELCRLAVAPGLRRRGLGWALFSRALRFARARGYRLCLIYTSSANPAALPLYKAAGFHLHRAYPPPEVGPLVQLLCQVTDYVLTLRLSDTHPRVECTAGLGAYNGGMQDAR